MDKIEDFMFASIRVLVGLVSIALLLGILVCMAIGIGTLLSSKAEAKQIRIGVIDTGFKETKISDNASYNPKLCNNIEFKVDTTGHGTRVVSVMAKQLNDAKIDYCLIPIDVVYPTSDDVEFTKSYIKALNKAEALELDILNISWSGHSKIEGECLAIARMIHDGTRIVSAAGNNSSNDLAYPGKCHNDTYKVFNIEVDGSFTRTSNTYTEPLNRAVKVNAVDIPALSLTGEVTRATGTSIGAAITAAKMAISISKGDRCYDSQGFSRLCY